MKDKIKLTILTIIVLAIFTLYVIIPFANPDMTNTRLFLEFWEIYIPSIIILFIVGTKLDDLI